MKFDISVKILQYSDDREKMKVEVKEEKVRIMP